MMEDYFRKTVTYERPLFFPPGDDPNLIVVIPAYAEKQHLFKTLRSLAENPPDALERTLILCVINNEEGAEESIRENNAQTMGYLRGLITGRPDLAKGEGALKEDLDFIARSPLRIGFIDASSPGYEIPLKDKGVGTARKIGMDAALRLLWPGQRKKGLIASLDADTTVRSNYISALKESHSGADGEAFVIDYEHPLPEDPFLAKAICNYEIFLRYYVLGLRCARSPYAYHVLGSAMMVTGGAYLAVRGMCRRQGGEDFYFLNKVAKVCPIRRIRSTRVFPLARISRRVPFGTGINMEKSVRKNNPDWKVYHPEAFFILSRWLMFVQEAIYRNEGDTETLMQGARSISNTLYNFLARRHFRLAWEKILSQREPAERKINRFHEWFDAFQTLKLVRELSVKELPLLTIEEALDILREKMEKNGGNNVYNFPKTVDRMEILNFLRSI